MHLAAHSPSHPPKPLHAAVSSSYMSARSLTDATTAAIAATAAASVAGVIRCAALVYDIAQRLVSQVRVWQQQEADDELQGSLDLLWPHEVLHLEHTLDELQPTRARIFWQTGQVGGWVGCGGWGTCKAWRSSGRCSGRREAGAAETLLYREMLGPVWEGVCVWLAG